MKKIILVLLSVILVTTVYFSWPIIKVFIPSTWKQSQEIPKPNPDTTSLWLDTLPNAPLSHLVLGDSVARGYGSKLNGFVGIATNDLNNNYGKQFTLTNLGVDGATSSDFLKSLEKEATLAKIQKANLITVNIGGNDILKLDYKMGITQGIKVLGTTRDTYSKNLEKALQIIREHNPTAVIVVPTLYIPIQLDDKLMSLINSFLTDWNNDITSISHKYGPVVMLPANEVLTYETRKEWAYDAIHPNDVGYKKLADKMIEELANYRLEK